RMPWLDMVSGCPGRTWIGANSYSTHRPADQRLAELGPADLLAAREPVDTTVDMSRRTGGQSLVELALIAPVLLLLLLFMVDAGRIFADWIALSNAAREGAYLASFNYSGDTTDQAI